MLFSWCCRWFFPITSPAVQELDRKVTMAEQIATMRYRMNAFMFWFMIFFLPPAKFRFFLFPQIPLRRSTLRNDSFRGLESCFHFHFLFSQLGRYFSPTGQVILRAFWITMQRYEIPIYQVCDSVRYHAIPEHFYFKHLTFNIEKASVPSDSIAGPSPAKLTLNTNHQ